MNTKKELALNLITSMVKDCDDGELEMMYRLLNVAEGISRDDGNSKVSSIVNQVGILLEAIKECE